jgi:hypothetical protein
MEWWREANHPLVKVVAGFSVLLFLALNFPTAFLAILTGVLLYAIALLRVMHTYRRGHRIVGRPELALQLAAKTFSKFNEYCNRKVARGWERHQSRKTLHRQRKARLRRYRRECNRRKREQARRTLAPTPGAERWSRSP